MTDKKILTIIIWTLVYGVGLGYILKDESPMKTFEFFKNIFMVEDQ